MENFCKQFNITEDQFYGKEKIPGDLYLKSVTSLPEGFNPIVGGTLDLYSVTSLPEGFNPIVGGTLDLYSVTSLPEGFNPIVGGNLYLSSVTSLPEGFNPTVGRSLDLKSGYSNQYTKLPENYMFTWENGKYIKVDGIFAEVISKHLNVWKCRTPNTESVFYIVTDGMRYAHGQSIDEARESLKYKIGDRDPSKYKGLSLETELGFWEMVECYRVITGACEFGVKEFLKRTCTEERNYRISEVIEKTKGEYGGEIFKKFFTVC